MSSDVVTVIVVIFTNGELPSAYVFSRFLETL